VLQFLRRFDFCVASTSEELMQRLVRILWPIGLIILLASASIPSTLASPSPQDANPVTVHIAMPAPTNLDPVQLSRFDPNARDLAENLFVGLTRFDPVTRQIEPMLAKDWSISEDGLTWTFNLRDDIQWVRYDPTTQETVAVRPVVAGDFVYAVQRACDPLRPSPVTTNLMIVKGCLTVANAFPEIINDLFIAREIGVRATGPETLEIDLLFPASYFPSLLSTPEFRPLARESVRASESTWAAGPAMMTNGPYVLQAWEPGSMALARNPYWPDSYSGNVELIDVTFAGETSPVSAFAGHVDMARLAPGQIAATRTTYPDLLRITQGTTLTMLGFSYDRNLVSTPEIRRALAQAIDRSALVQQFFPDQALPVTQFTPPGVVAAPVFDNTLYDPTSAQADYAAAGYAGCDGVPEPLIVLVPEEDPLWMEVAQFITQQWSAVLGCNPVLFEVKSLSRTLMIELAHSTYDPDKVTRSHIWLTTWSPDYPDANAWVADALHCRFGYIRTGRECSEADDMLDRASLESDPAKRAGFYAQAEQLFFGPNGDFPVIPLFISSSAWLQQPWLDDVNEYGSARYDLWQLDTSAQP
jgi:oligopeptide transport system substrate-binding protein